MVPTLHVQLLGDFRLAYGDTPLTSVNTSRLKSLLAFLLLHRDSPQSRQHLAFLFWPDTSEEQARANLRNLIHFLKRALPEDESYLVLETQTIQWNPQVQLVLDVEAFTRLTDRTASRANLQQAVDLYRGDLLLECYDDWIQPEREQLRQVYFNTLNSLIGELEGERDYPGAIVYAQRLVQADPLQENASQWLMRLHAAAGDRARALHVYHSCASLLERELGVEPGEELQAAYQRLLNLEEAPAVQETRSKLPLIARQAEWGIIQSTWRATSRGHAQGVLVKGEAGIGKTRLVEEMIDWAGRQGIATASGYCYASGRGLAYAPVAAWLRARPLPKIEALWLSETARLLPELLVEYPDLPRPEPITEGWQRLRLFKGLAHTLLRDCPALVLSIEDLHWCDRDTLEWIAYLLQNQAEIAPRNRLLWMGTMRTGETASDHPVETLLKDLRRADCLAEIELHPLNEVETAELARQVDGKQAEPGWEKELYRETEGNPLFVVETVRLLRGKETEESGGTASLPSKVQEVIMARLGQLTPAARELAESAAVIGRQFAFLVLNRVAGGDEEKVVGGLDELWRRRIVREMGQDAYDFSHDKIREIMYQSLSIARRKLLHNQVAKALEAAYANELDNISGQIAAHYEHAGKIETAVRWYQRAAESSRRIYANQTAIDFYSVALALLKPSHLDPGMAAQLIYLSASLYEDLGDVLAGLRQLDEANENYQAALIQVSSDNPFLQARLRRKVGRISPDKEAAEIYAVCEEILVSQADKTAPAWWHEWIELNTDRLWNYYRLGRTTEVLELIPKLQPVVESRGTPSQRIHYFLSLALQDDLVEILHVSDECVGYLKVALIAARESGNLTDIALVHHTLGAFQTYRDEFEDAERELQASLKLTEQTGDLFLKARSLCALTFLYRRRGLVEETRNCVSLALEASQAARSAYYITLSQANMAWVAWRDGKLEQARQLSLVALAEPSFESENMAWAALWPLVSVCAVQNQMAEAVEYSRRIFACKY